MKTIQIQVKDSYSEKFLNFLWSLPQDKIQIIDEAFKEDKKILHKVVEKYRSGKVMKELDIFLRDTENER